MSGPRPATGPCPHGVVDAICWRCTPDEEVVHTAGRILSRGEIHTGRTYEAIGVELERIAGELEELRAAVERTRPLFPPGMDPVDKAIERLEGRRLPVPVEEALRRFWSYPCSFGFEYHGEMTEEEMRAVLGMPDHFDLEDSLGAAVPNTLEAWPPAEPEEDLEDG